MLRIGEWSADGEMKETKGKTIWAWIKMHKKETVLWSVVILIVVPLAVYGLSEISFLPVTGGNDWAGFWGGYIGAIIGGLITLFVMQYTIKSENVKSKRQEKIQYFNDVIKISAEFFEVVGNLAMKMTRYMATPTNEKYEQVLEEGNRGARISIILEIMLTTRKKEYDLNLYTNEIIHISDKVNDVREEFEKIIQDIFSDTDKNQEFDLKLDELMQDIENGKTLLEEAVKDNLYGA